MAIAASVVWRVRPGGNNANGGGYDSVSYPGGTDYSQQDAAQATWATGTNGLTCTGSASVTLTDGDARGLFTAAMVGNAIQIAGGTGFTAGFYFVASYTDANNVTLDRSPASSTSAASGATGGLGGAWADFWTNTSNCIPGNIVYVMGSGIPNPADYVFDYTMATIGLGSTIPKGLTISADPATPDYTGDATGGMPTLRGTSTSFSYNMPPITFHNILFYLEQLTGNAGFAQSRGIHFVGCVFDQGGNDSSASGAAACFIGCEFFNSGAGATTGFSRGITQGDPYANLILLNCNIHDWGAAPIQIIQGTISNCIIAHNNGHAIQVSAYTTENDIIINNNTIDGNVGSGIIYTAIENISSPHFISCYGNIISNHTSGSAAMDFSYSGTLAQNDGTKMFFDYNVFWNNTTDLNSLSYGPHDTSNSGAAPKLLTQSPYVDSSTQNYTLA